ncbi:MAG: glycoside hydrolase family 15 protein [Actinomycetota bacterium]|nr:glycoside hydrolase family 15 protein [Actinomycetota bacterium]
MNRIGDYALIGDCHSAALVGKDGAIDWACFPRFDSPAAFAKILDEARGGSFSVTAVGTREVRRAYLEGTNVLETRFTCETGELEVVDCMPIERSDPADTRAVRSHASIMRRIRCVAGDVDVAVAVAPRFEYGSFVPRFRLTAPTAAEIVGGADAMYVHSTHPLAATESAIEGRWRMHAGEEAWIDSVWRPSHDPKIQHGDPLRYRVEGARRLNATVDFWRTWIARCGYEGEYLAAVQRSALALKALTYAPSGAVIAAPTTSLPEHIGGGRNWDYRYTWIRDATLTLTALFVLGYTEEADAFKQWLERTGAGRPQDLQIMFGIGGERSLPEFEVLHLAGHRASAPVRVGNGAVKQMQLDSYGQILEAAWLYGKAGGELTPDNWQFILGLADIVCERWRKPDQGIWEIRDEPRHFVHSKLNCWIALDRAVRIATARGEPDVAEGWARERDEIREFLLTKAAPDGWFHQAVDFPVADASTLLVSASGFLPTNDALVLKTLEQVRATLEKDGLMYRYRADDGLEGGEGAFLLCSFWLLDCLIFAGRIEESHALLQRLLGFANDVGLFAEEVDPSNGELLGNFPQAFSHMALVTSCAHLAAAKRGEIPDGAVDYAEFALERLLTRIQRAQ